MENFIGKRKPTISLSLFTALSGSFSSDKTRSPRDFEKGVVGLGIVAAMTDSDKVPEAFVSSRAVSPRSCSIPIVSSAKPAANFRGGFNLEKEPEVVDELSEIYTCVTSHLENHLFEKRVYFNGEIDLINGRSSSVVRSGVFSTSPMSFGVAERGFCAADFLSSCYLCCKQLHGLDIFMYRGEKAFCSVECRDKHIRGDDCRDKCGSEAMKDYSASPCSVGGPRALASGVVAA
ncbi:uncharacterized protein LOC111018225 [Momordica charantia]|uniref:Uncharacterized protein LOC111018225 n=1 Tax=Momordica charantia TaxID=3673 RepID=A0A6J1D9X3_MOMCH|nr:uncharacterized protein LOC111018225 [Momordica charantia]